MTDLCAIAGIIVGLLISPWVRRQEARLKAWLVAKLGLKP